MAGKRPDQYNIEPSEAGATDYKNLPQTGRGQGGPDLRNLPDGDKQRLAQSSKDAKGQPFPPDVPAPTADTRRGTKLDEDEVNDTPGAKDTNPGKENPLV